MSDYPVMIKRLHGRAIVRAAAKHNLREIAAEIGADSHIDAARIHTNIVLRGATDSDDVAKRAKALMADAGITRLRSNAVMALELVFTLAANTTINLGRYFEDATRWAEQYYQVPVLSSVIHLDEAAPHCHVLLLPLLEGHMVGSDLHGGRTKLMAMQIAFHEQVRAHYGMERAVRPKRHSAAVRAEAMQRARECLEVNSGLSDAVLAVLLKPHTKDPEPLLLALGIPMPLQKRKPEPRQSFVAIMTRPVKSDSPIGKATQNPIGKARGLAHEKVKPYTCVGLGPSAMPLQTLEQQMLRPEHLASAKHDQGRESAREQTST